jgi:hypothetical protein
VRRYERASTLLTSNQPVEDWGKLLGDVWPSSSPCSTAACIADMCSNGSAELAGQELQLLLSTGLLHEPLKPSLGKEGNDAKLHPERQQNYDQPFAAVLLRMPTDDHQRLHRLC